MPKTHWKRGTNVNVQLPNDGIVGREGSASPVLRSDKRSAQNHSVIEVLRTFYVELGILSYHHSDASHNIRCGKKTPPKPASTLGDLTYAPKYRRKPHHDVQRTRLHGPLRGHRPLRLQRRRIPLPIRLSCRSNTRTTRCKWAEIKSSSISQPETGQPATAASQSNPIASESSKTESAWRSNMPKPSAVNV